LEHHPLLETYGSSIVIPEQHPRSRYLLLVQALEGLYGYEHKAELQLQEQRHLAMRNMVVSAVQFSLYREAQKFLKKYLMRRPPGSLDTCLRDLFGVLPVDVLPQLAGTPLVQQLQNDERRPQDIPHALRLVRNDLSHGTKAYETRYVAAIADILEDVARAHLLRLLGGSIEVQRRALMSRHEP